MLVSSLKDFSKELYIDISAIISEHGSITYPSELGFLSIPERMNALPHTFFVL
jgi:hypothetical protein